MGRLHVAGLLLEDGGAAAGEGVHVGGDGVDGHMAGSRGLLDGVLVPHAPQRRRVRAGWRSRDGG